MTDITTEDKLKTELERIRGVRVQKERMLKIKDEIKLEKNRIRDANRVDLNPAVVAAHKKVREIAGSAVKNATQSVQRNGGFGNLFKADMGQSIKKKKSKQDIDMFNGVFD